jgi:hypothetical protein
MAHHERNADLDCGPGGRSYPTEASPPGVPEQFALATIKRVHLISP